MRQTGVIPNLILVNGAPGLGKSTLARRYAAEHRLALNLDIDVVRTWLGRWRDEDESKSLARTLALAMARAQLVEGHDVIVPQLVARAEFIDQLAQVARDTNAVFHEVLLVDTESSVLERFRHRRAELEAENVDHPQEELDSSRDAQVLRETQESLRRVAEQRTATVVVPTAAGEVDAAYDALLSAVRS